MPRRQPRSPSIGFISAIESTSASSLFLLAMSAAFAACDAMVLAVPPEGTRSRVGDWKSGFYHIAVGAGVPLVLSVLDYGRKTVTLAAVIHPGGDYEADLALIRTHYADAVGKNRAQFAAPV